MSANLIADIEEMMPEFSKSQKYIARYITEHYEKAAFMTAAKLGATVGVSESTVVRFADEMGFDGYPEMQKALQSYGRNRLTTLQRLDISNDRFGGDNLLKTVMMQDIERIRCTFENISETAFNEAVDEIIHAKTIYIFGAMSSDILARFLVRYLSLSCENVVHVQPINSSGILQQLIRVTSDDVFISISFPRYFNNTLTATAFAKKCGADIIAITDSDASPLVEYADQVLLAKSDIISYADSLAAPLSLINALVAAVGMRNSTRLAETLTRLEEVWAENAAYKKDDDK
ncbi:MAG: MurR/RpiR family transcriptional regulator [Ruminiclostridium sp.]|nr:MurR/RpiR family transcriptional regulator [Ruminiclostridium sp.]